MKSLTNTILFFNRSNRINLIKGNIKPFSIFINSKSNLINNMNKSNFKNFNNKLFTLSNNNNNLFNLQNKNFSGCGNGGCGSSNCSSHKPEEDEIEKNLKSLNQRVIQCINLGQFDDALELSDEFINQVKSHFGKKIFLFIYNLLNLFYFIRFNLI
jgi:hypothetical protein